MSSSCRFDLKVWYRRAEETCFFALFWQEGSKNLVVSQKYSQQLSRTYQDWLQQYLRYYHLSPSQSFKKSGGLSWVTTGDRSNDLRETEKVLLSSFQRWLGEGEFRRIERILQENLTRSRQQLTDKSLKLEIFLACSPELAKLPWELWASWLIPDGMARDAVRLIRTSLEPSQESFIHPPSQRARKPRILAIIGSDPLLSLAEDWKILRSLRAIAEVERIEWQPEDSNDQIKNRVLRAITDDRGWDLLFFCGHSDETSLTGGRITLTPTISFSISDIEDRLKIARQNGLKVAVFNSCCGLSLAQALVDLGLQVVVMREPIDDQVAQRFLKQFCQQLKLFKDIQEALLTSCQYLQSAEKISSPSAYLIPSFFSPLGVSPFRLEPFGLKQQLRQWIPTKREAIFVSLLLLICLMVPLQDFLLDLRYLSQAIYRQLLVPQQNLPTSLPPVQIIEVDEDSANEILADGYNSDPIDRRYLAEIIQQLAELKTKVIGIEYIIDHPSPNDSKFQEAIKQAVIKQQTWFIFALKQDWDLAPKVINQKWNWFGHNYLYLWDVTLPEDRTCEKLCPFAYSLLIAHQFANTNQFSKEVVPSINSQTSLKKQVTQYFKSHLNSNQITLFLDDLERFFGVRKIVDFSRPYYQAYHKISAKDFLDKNYADRLHPQAISQQVVVISAGDYDRQYKSIYQAPFAFEYWCFQQQKYKIVSPCSQQMTAGEAHAYRLYDFLKGNQIILVPDLLFILMAVISGKGVNILSRKQSKQQLKRILLISMGAIVLYTIVCLNLYLFGQISIPWLLPSLTFLLYLIPIVRRKFNA